MDKLLTQKEACEYLNISRTTILRWEKRMKNMKTTVRAVLINISEESEIEINRLMTVFSSAIRYGFNRVLKGKEKDGEIEKDISRKYGLNIRQSKDALKRANEIIKSQKELVKEHYNNYSKKVKIVEKQIEKAKSDKKINALNKKLDKIKNKGGETPGLWQRKRKNILDIA